MALEIGRRLIGPAQPPFIVAEMSGNLTSRSTGRPARPAGGPTGNSIDLGVVRLKAKFPAPVRVGQIW